MKNKKGFTLIELAVSIVLVSIVLIALIGSLLQIRDTYNVIHENSDIIVYASSISRVINRDINDNNGIKYVSCEPEGKKCSIILGNDDRREIIITDNDKVINDLSDSNITHSNNKTTLKYLDTTKYDKTNNEDDKSLIYIRTLELDKYENGERNVTTTNGYNFYDMSAAQYEYFDNSGSNIEAFTTIVIRLLDGINMDVSDYDITLYGAGKYDYSNYIGRVYTIDLDNSDADTAGTTRIDEVFGVGFFKAESNHRKEDELKKITIPTKEGKAFLGYYYQPYGVIGETKIIDSGGSIIASSRLFKNDVKLNEPETGKVYAKWGDCEDGFHVVNGNCVQQIFTVNLNRNTTGKTCVSYGTSSYQVSYLDRVRNVEIPQCAGYTFEGYFSVTNKQYHNRDGEGIEYYDIGNDSTFNANWHACVVGEFSLATQQTCTSCAKGSISTSQGSGSCTACGNGKTTSDIKSTSCNADCSNKNDHVLSWKTPTWNNNNTITNLCTINECKTGYDGEVSSNKCTVNNYKILYTLNSGTHGSSHPTTANYNQTITISNPTRTGYNFDGWTLTNGNPDTAMHGSSAWTNLSTPTKDTTFKNLTATDEATVTLVANWTKCAAGTYNNGNNSTCTTCPAGSYCPEGSTTPIACPAGTYTGSTGQSVCLSCPAGKYNTGSGNTSCTSCAIGSYTNTPGKTACLACQPTGETGSSGTTTNVGQSSCNKSCNNNHVSTWVTSQWNTNNTLTNNCKISDCVIGYSLDNNSCIANIYAISYSGMDGALFGTNHPIEAIYDESFNVNAPTKTGSTFNGWNITGMDSVTHTYGSNTTTNTSINGTKATTFKNLRSTLGTVTFTATWTINTYTLTVNPNGGTWSGSTSNQTFTQNYGTTKTIANPTSGPTYTITYNMNGTGISAPTSPTSVQRPFINWTKNGGGTFSENVYTFESGNGSLIANYSSTSNTFTLPSINKTGYTCKWAEGSTTGTQYVSGANRTLTENTTYYAICSINSYALTVNPNGGTWSGSTSNQVFTQDYGTTKTIANPTAGPTYTITYNMNGTGVTAPTSPTSVQRPFTSWTKTGNGSLNGTTYTYGAGAGTLTATYNTTSSSFTLPSISKTGYTCKWAEGSTTGTQYAGNTSRTITSNTTYYAVCTINEYTLTIKPNGGTWNGSSSNQTFNQNYGTTKTIANPTAGPTYTITYNMNGTGITAPTSPTSVQRPFTSWTKSGTGSFSGNTFTYGAGNGVLTATYNSISSTFVLPSLSKTGYTCKWAEESATGTQYAPGTSRTISGNMTYYAVCTTNSYALTVKPNGGTWSGSSSNQAFTQNYGTTKTIDNPTSGPTYTITYNMNGTGITAPTSPTSVQRSFSSWTNSGSGTFNSSTKVYTYGAGSGTLTANYNTTSNSFTLPSLSKTGYTCKWAEGAVTGVQLASGSSRTITENTTYYAICTINSYTLTVKPNGGTWNSSSSDQTFTQDYNTTKTIDNPTAGPTYTITYNMNGTGITAPTSPKSVQRPFTSWENNGSGSFSGNTFTFGAGAGILEATYNTTSSSFRLPTISKQGYTCKWAEGSTNGIQYSGGTSRSISANMTYYAKCEVNTSILTIKPNGGKWDGSTSDQSFTEAYGSTKTIEDPSVGAKYNISFVDNGQNATFTSSPSSVERTFDSWTGEAFIASEGWRINNKVVTFGTGSAALKAIYNDQSNSFALPSISKEGNTCKWAEGSTSGTQYVSGTIRTINSSMLSDNSMKYYAVCSANSYALTVKPNGGMWNGSTSDQVFTQAYGTTKTLETPTSVPAYTISYNMNGTGITAPTSPSSAPRAFTSWSHSGSGSISGNTYTYGAGAGTLTATYKSTSNEIPLPPISKTGYTCKWAKGSASGTQYAGSTNVTLTANTIFYAVCTINSYTLTVNPNGGTWSGSSSNQTFTQNYGTTKTIDNPTAGPTYTISYNMNGTGVTAPTSPKSVQRPFTSWSNSGNGSISETTYTFGAGNGTLTATYSTTSNQFTLPSISKNGSSCKWAEGSTSGTQYAGGTVRTITGNKTYYAICSINSYTLTVNPNGGTWSGSTSNQVFTQNYGTTKTIDDPTVGPTYTISYNMNGTGETAPTSPKSASRQFTGWTNSGSGTFNSSTKVYTYGAGAGTLTASYSGTSDEIQLPPISKTGYTCKWAKGSASGTQYAGETNVTVTGNTTYYAVCTINSYTLTVKPNGGSWSGSTSNQTFTQNYGTTKTIANPTSGPSYTISYNMNGTGIATPTTPTSVQRDFDKWTRSGSGSISGTTYTYGPGNGTLTANYKTTSKSFELPEITKTGYSCQWAEGSTSGTQYAGESTRTINGNTTYYAICILGSYNLVVNPNGGTWSGSTESQTFSQDYNSTKTISDPTVFAKYTISYNMNSSGVSAPASPKNVTRKFTGWTKTGSGTWNSSTKVFTFGAGTGNLTANYNTTSDTFTLPTITITGHTCKWAEGSNDGTQYAGGSTRTINSNTTYYFKDTINSYTLTVNPNGGTWSGSTSNQVFTQEYNSTKSIADATGGPTYTITYDDNGQEATFTGIPTSVGRPFSGWTNSGSGTWNSSTKVYTYGAGAGTLTASFSTTSSPFTLPEITKIGHTCKWAEGSASGTQYAGNTSRTITGNKTYYAVCSSTTYSLTVKPNGGTWNGSTSNSTISQSYGTTKTIEAPTAVPKYTITYNMNSTGATAPSSPTSVNRSFTGWTNSGSGTWNSSTNTYTFGAGNGTLTANYSSTGSFTLPSVTLAGHTCKWAEGSASGTVYSCNTQRTISSNQTYYFVPTKNSYTLTVKPNGGTWNNSTSDQTFTQEYQSTKTIVNPTGVPTYTVTYNANSQGATFSNNSVTIQRPFNSWTKSGTGTWNSATNLFTYGAGAGTLTATYASSVNVTLQSITKTGYTCKWAVGSASGTQYAGDSSLSISGNTTVYAVCTIKQYKLTVKPNGGTWSGSTSDQEYYQNYNTTRTVADPTYKYTISYNMNGTGIAAPSSPTSVNRLFNGWTKTGSGTWNSSTKTYTYGAGDGILTASYASASDSFTLPALSKEGYTCRWAEGSVSGAQYAPGTSRTIISNTTYYAVCTIGSHSLTVNPNGGTWSGSTSPQSFSQEYGSTKSIVDPSATTKYNITYNMNGTGIAAPSSPKSVNRAFTGWTNSGSGTWNSSTKVYTYGDGDGTLTANYNSTSNSISLPCITLEGHTCQWAKGSASGTKINCNTDITLTANTTFYAVCTINNSVLTINPNGGKWNNKTTNSTITQNYNTTYTVADATAGPTYTISYNMNGYEEAAPTTPTSVTRPFTSWTLSGGGEFNSSTKVYTFKNDNGTLKANYSSTSNPFTLPTVSKIGHTCQWAKGSASGTKINCDTSTTITANTTYYYSPVINPYTLTVKPNGGTWNNSTSNQQFTQNYNTSKTISDPTVGPTYTITYNMGDTGIAAPTTPTSVVRAFDGWTNSGSGTFNSSTKTYTYGAGNGTLTAKYKTVSNEFTLPTVTLSNYIITWAEGDLNGTEYACGTKRTISANTTYYAKKTVKPYTLTINPNGGKWNNKTTNSTITQNYNTTYTVADATAGPTYTISYNMNGYEEAAPTTPTSVTRPFTSWTLSGGGEFNSSTKVYTFKNDNGTLKANYSSTSNPFTLPTVSKIGYTCRWAKGSASGTRINCDTSTTITENTTYYYSPVINPYTLTVKPNGGTWNNSTANQQFTQNYNTSKTISDPTAGPTYTIGYNMNGTGITVPSDAPTSVERPFSSWANAGSGTFNSSTKTYTYGAGDGTLTANYNTTSNTFVLPSYSLSGYLCKWALNSASGTQYNCGASRTINANAVYYATPVIRQYSLTIRPNGGVWQGNTENFVQTQDYNSTYVVADPSEGPTFRVTLYPNSQDATYVNNGPYDLATTLSNWTLAGSGTWTESTKKYKYGAGNGTLTAQYSTVFTLPTITKTGYTCKWAKGSETGDLITGGTTETITGNIKYYASCTINKYTLTIKPNGGKYNNNTNNTVVTQNYNSTYTVSTPTDPPTYTVTLNGNSQGATFTNNGPYTIATSFASWGKTGTGEFDETTNVFTYKAGNGNLNARYRGTFTLPTITKTGYTCKWADGSVDGEQYAGGTNRTITADKTYYAVCTIDQHTLTIKPNGGKYNSTTSNTTVTQNYNSTYTVSNPTNPPTYTVTLNDNSQGATFDTDGPYSVTTTFKSWTKSGGGTLSGTTYTFGTTDGILTAKYSGSYTLPSIYKYAHSCKWAEGSINGNQYEAGVSRTISANTTYYAVCTLITYTLTVNPNGGTWNGSALDGQTITGSLGQQIEILDPEVEAVYTISYNANGQGATYTASPTSVERLFLNWTKTGKGTLDPMPLGGYIYTFGEGNATITANYNIQSKSFTLPTITKTGYTCKWAENSPSGSQFYGGVSIKVLDNTTFYAVCESGNTGSSGSKIVSSNGVVYYISGGKHCSPKNGNTFECSNPTSSQPITASKGVVYYISNGKECIADDGNIFDCNNPTSSQPIAASNGVVYYISNGKECIANSGNSSTCDAPTSTQPIAASNGNVYYISNGKYCTASSGNYSTCDSPTSTQPIAASNGLVYYISNGKYCTASSQSYLTCSNPTDSQPIAASNGNIYYISGGKYCTASEQNYLSCENPN